MGWTPSAPQEHLHRPRPVQVGEHIIYAGAGGDFFSGDLNDMDVLVPLAQVGIPLEFGQTCRIISAQLEDFGGVPSGWKKFLGKVIIPELVDDKRLLAFCGSGHGRTGTLLASLVALLEDPAQTPDPIAAVRERYCEYAVDTVSQGEAIFALRGKLLPDKYETLLLPPSGGLRDGFFGS